MRKEEELRSALEQQKAASAAIKAAAEEAGMTLKQVLDPAPPLYVGKALCNREWIFCEVSCFFLRPFCYLTLDGTASPCQVEVKNFCRC